MKPGIGIHSKGRRKGNTGRGRKAGRNPVAAGVTVTLVVVTLAPGALANPQNGQVVAGQATISSSGTRLEVRQSTENAVVNWHSFSIAPGEHTHFQQPSATSTTLNRVTGADPSAIAGRMSANGRVILVNPNGIAFSQGAQVDVNSLIATTADIADRDFMKGRLRFDRPSDKIGAAVSNEGEITVQEAGLAALVAPTVVNSGTINAKLGKVVLGGADAFVLDLHGDGLIAFQIVEPASADTGNNAGNTSERRSASNSGTIRADGGIVEITAADARAVVDGVVNMTGVVSARTVHRTGGKVVIGGGRTGTVTVDGQVDVSGTAPGQAGGSVAVLGRDVRLGPAARIDASGQAGGGRIEVGGSMQGRGPQPNARRSIIDSGAKIKADALDNGNGGTAIVWADETTWFGGTISARGGAAGGNGGFVEVSGKQKLVFRGTIDTLAPAGYAGTTLLDPVDIVIASAVTNDDGLLSLTGVLQGDGTAGSNATFTPTSLALLKGTVVLQAARDITVTDPVTFGADATSASLQAGRSLFVNAAVGTTGGASLDLLAGRDFVPAYGGSAGTLVTTAAVGGGGTGAVSFAAGTGGITLGGNVTAAGNVSFAQSVKLGTGAVTIDTTNGGAMAAGGNVQFSGTLDGNGRALQIGAGTGGAVSVDGAATNLAGLALNGGGTVDLKGDVAVNAGGSLDLSGKTGGSVTVRGALTTPTLTTSGNNYSVALLGGGTVDNAVTFLNTGTVTLGDGASDDLHVTGGLSTAGNATNPTSTSAAGTIRSTNQPITLGTVALTADTVVNAGTASVTLSGVTGDKELTLTADGLALAGAAGSMAGTGALVLQPASDGTSIGLGGAAGTFNLTTAELATLGNGFSSITIGRVTGTHAITMNAVSFQDPVIIRAPQGAGSVTVNGSITVTDNASVVLTGASGIALNAGITTAGGSVTLSNAVTLGGNPVGSTVAVDTTNGGAAAAGGNVQFSGTLDGNGRALQIGAGTGGAVSVDGAATNLAGLALNGGGTVDLKGDVAVNAGGSLDLSGKTGGSVTVRGALTTPTLTTSGNNYSVALLGGGTVDNAVTFLNTGTVTLGDGASDDLHFTGGLSTAGNATNPTGTSAAGTIRSTNQPITLGATDLGANAVIDTSNGDAAGIGAAIRIASVTGNGRNLQVISHTGTTTITGSAGGLGTLALQNDSSQAIGDVSLQGDLSAAALTTFGRAYNLSLTGGLNSITGTTVFRNLGTLTLGDSAADQTTFTGGVTATAASSKTLAGRIVTSNAAIDLSTSATMLTADVVLSSGSGDVSLAAVTSATDGGAGLTVTSSGTTRLGGTVGGAAVGPNRLSSLNSDSGGTTVLSGGSVRTTGSQSYGDAVTLGGDMTLSGTDVIFSDTVNSASGLNKALVVSASGTTSFVGAVGGVDALSGLTSGSGGTTVLSGGSVRTTGSQSYGDAVTLGGDMTLSGTDVTFSDTVNSAGGLNKALVVSASGTTSFNGAVGGGDALSGLTSDGGGTTVLSGGSVRTTGSQSYGDAVTLTTSSTLTSTAVGRISFGGTVDPSADRNAGLALVTGGDVVLGGAVGGTFRLGALTVTGAYNLSAGSSIRATSLSHSGGGGTSSFSGSLDTNAAPGISILNGSVSIGGSVTTGNNNLVISASGPGSLVLSTNYDAGTAAAQITAGGTIMQTGGVVTAGTLTGSAGGSASLTQANGVTTLGGFTTGSGGFAFTNAASLTVSGPLKAGGDLALAVSGTNGTLTLDSSLSAAGHAIGLKAGGSISQKTADESAALTAQTLLVRAGVGGAGSAELTNRSNAIASAIAGSAAGAFDFANSGTVALGSLSAVGAVDGTAGVQATGAGGTVRLLSGTGDVLQTGGASISASNLLVHAGRSSGSGSVVLADTGNRVSGAVAGSAGRSGGAGRFTFVNGSGISVADGSTVAGAGTIDAQAGIAAAGRNGAIGLHTLTGDISQQDQAPLIAATADLRAGLAGSGSVALGRVTNTVGEISGSATGSFAVATGTALRIAGDGLTAGTEMHLQALGGDVTQAAGAVITAPKLLVQASGGIALTNPGNAIGIVAGTAGASIRLHTRGDLTVGSVAGTTTGEVKGLTASGELAEIRVGRQGAGSLTLDQPVLAAEKTFLQAHGDVTVPRSIRFSSRTVVIDTTDDASFGPGDFAAGDASPAFLTLAKRRPPVNGNIMLGQTYAEASELRLFAGSGAIAGAVHVKGLGIAGVGGSASLSGTVGGRSGTAAAQLVFKQLPRENSYKFNSCAVGGVTCVVLPPFEPVRPAPTLSGPLFHQVFPSADPIRDSLIGTGNEDFIRRWTK